MSRRLSRSAVVVSLGLAACLIGSLSAPAGAQEDGPLTGAWVVERIEFADGESIDDPQPLLLLLTETHYAIMGTPAGSPRPAITDPEPTEAEKAAAYDSFFASSGRYAVEGDSLTYRAYASLEPGYADGYPDNPRTRKIRVAGDTLHWHAAWGVLTFRRAAGGTARY